LKDWHRECGSCSYEGSDLEPHIQAQSEGGDLDETARETSLETLRKENFRHLRDRIQDHLAEAGRRKSLLDVGCAHGWFIEQCRDGFDVIGIEPDLAVAQATKHRGLPVRTGYFPDAVATGERFDVITFNDVLEHIPDLGATMEACRTHLGQDGLLVVNAPSRQGVFYQLSRLLARLGVPGPFERMWQKGFPSPHVHYFDTATMSSIASRHGFVLASRSTLPSVSVKGLYSRIRYSRNVSPLKAGAIASVVTALSPFLRILPADISVWIFRRGELDAARPAAAQ
jgi:2-polyprenyl-3-methyl-5-hydroxy-6-metoxy-1,4-benzoquinol methylase